MEERIKHRNDKENLMRCKSDFVTNSSSSSFVILTKDLTKSQIRKIMENKDVVSSRWKIGGNELLWWVAKTKEVIIGATMQGGDIDMKEFLEDIGIDESKIGWDEGETNIVEIIRKIWEAQK
jgi:hypothetical protein